MNFSPSFKSFLGIFCLALSTGIVSADTIKLKNGSVIKGIITEQTPPAQLKIQTARPSSEAVWDRRIPRDARRPGTVTWHEGRDPGR